MHSKMPLKDHWNTKRKLTTCSFSPHWRGFRFSLQDMRIIAGTLLLALCVQQAAAQNQQGKFQFGIEICKGS